MIKTRNIYPCDTKIVFTTTDVRSNLSDDGKPISLKHALNTGICTHFNEKELTAEEQVCFATIVKLYEQNHNLNNNQPIPKNIFNHFRLIFSLIKNDNETANLLLKKLSETEAT
ncbi:MAG: hypothetical protein WC725_04995 [Patescibacteria group bacterium]|jgi:hypothetical protein